MRILSFCVEINDLLLALALYIYRDRERGFGGMMRASVGRKVEEIIIWVVK